MKKHYNCYFKVLDSFLLHFAKGLMRIYNILLKDTDDILN